MVKGINHIGIAVSDIGEMVKFLTRSFGAQEISRTDYPELKQTSALVRIGDGCLEVMQPTGEGSVIGKFLQAKGGGLHHIPLLCEDVETLAKDLEMQGLEVVGRTNEGTHRVASLHPKTTKGVLFELSEKPSLPPE